MCDAFYGTVGLSGTVGDVDSGGGSTGGGSTGGGSTGGGSAGGSSGPGCTGDTGTGVGAGAPIGAPERTGIAIELPLA